MTSCELAIGDQVTYVNTHGKEGSGIITKIFDHICEVVSESGYSFVLRDSIVKGKRRAVSQYRNGKMILESADGDIFWWNR